MNTVFDAKHTERIMVDRLAMAMPALNYARDVMHARTLLDVGCGVGNAARVMTTRGFQVSATDFRKDNIAEAQARSDKEAYFVADVERDLLPRNDVVLCLGLMYHLENPMVALRHIVQATRHMLVLETRTSPGAGTHARLVCEGPGVDQSERGIALVPSRDLVVATLRHSGLRVYELKKYRSKLKDFVWDPKRKWRRRIMLVCTRIQLPHTTLGLVPVSVKIARVGEIWK